ncbi:LacI family DNA-binding transcriptional regulator [Mucilaginibacter sp. cycad4]|uniref:LacI family DNA-binding transcriptional regulator n=1 Tax=Mucilaginibacter sp. cycad4 TaxID=3342096 RepID=UPI002AAA6B00|nr:LacI family DNA-binding transcriptional regulator [Mucilaginibacter gossypii]WPU97312.1 LacI family DNA-binding transcriptional regulator [Mucilaginibacter gossypii]
MNFGGVTIKDIAKELGISPSAVSKALKDSHEIGEKTKALVLECAKRLNYQPNLNAQSLKRGNSKSIGIVVSTIENQFFSQVINGIESVAHSKGYNVFITQTHESYELEIQNVRHLTFRSIDGLLISLSTETQNIDHLKNLHEKGLPIVFFDRVSDEIDTHKVVADNFAGAYNATTQLIEAGYRKIAHITSSVNVSITAERLRGYKQALEKHGIQPDEKLIKYCPHGGKDLAEIEKALSELLYADDKPDAIFTASDRITTTTLSLLHKLGFRIPADIALLGFTNTQLAEVLNPPLSAVYQPGFEMGKKATEMLISIIESKRPVTEFETTVLPTQVFIRSSSQPVKA